MRQTSAPAEPWRTQIITVDPSMVGGAKAVAVADLTLDGQLDIVLTCEGATEHKAGVAWAQLTDARTIPADRISSISGVDGVKFDLIALLDLDQDGDSDVITCEETDQLGLIWYENPTVRAERRPKPRTQR
jgi:hypothetical protein